LYLENHSLGERFKRSLLVIMKKDALWYGKNAVWQLQTGIQREIIQE